MKSYFEFSENVQKDIAQAMRNFYKTYQQREELLLKKGDELDGTPWQDEIDMLERYMRVVLKYINLRFMEGDFNVEGDL